MPIEDNKTNPLGGPKGRPLDIGKIAGQLNTKRLGRRFYYLTEIDSTNRYARDLAEGGANEGEVVIAESQSQGRGRLGRTWISPPYLNLYFSLILRPRLAPLHAPQITLMAAVALGDSFGSFLPCPAVIKWPNDILVDGKKLAGVLTESSCTATELEFVILGIGVNVNFPRELMPDGIRDRATSLMEIGAAMVDREAFLGRLIQDLDRCYGVLEESGFDALAPIWESRFGLRGCRVKVAMTDGVVTGRAQGIDADGALIVETGGGKRERIIAGDVIPLEE
jgi:BirA family biotin operon repressor/biotin-[acetyl-CoA-carboxylase] ligase